MKLAYNAKAVNGALKITNRNALVQDLEALEGKELILTIERKKKKRSLNQNGYYWSCVVPIVKQGLLDAGWEREKVNSNDAVHELLKHLFCPQLEVVNEQTGEVMKMPPTTTALTTTNMMEYFEDITRWAAEFLNITIPEPNEVMTLNFD